jgi:acyl carrier protein
MPRSGSRACASTTSPGSQRESGSTSGLRSGGGFTRGEDGVKGLKLGNDHPEGEAFIAFQRYCLRLRARGVLLAVCSKNDPEVALSGFTHPDSVLKPGDFSAFVASWEPKPAGLQRIARELNLGLDALVFVDDNPFERELVARTLPQVRVAKVSDPAQFAEVLDREGHFEPFSLTADDAAPAGRPLRADREERDGRVALREPGLRPPRRRHVGIRARRQPRAAAHQHREDPLMTTMERLQRLFRDVLDQPNLLITEATNAESIEGYDSLVHINIISAIEQEFDVRFELKDILGLENTGDMVALIERKHRQAA